MARRARPKLVADLMCGAGGTTDGAKAALEELGHDVEFVCLNHWSLAIATHTVNFPAARSEEHTSELQSLMRISYAVFCLKKQNNIPGYVQMLQTSTVIQDLYPKMYT